MIRSVIVIAFLLAVAGCSETTGSITPTPSVMKPLGYAFAPPAFYTFCDEQPRLCSTDGDEAAMTMTAQRSAELKAVNEQVNRGFRQRDDKPGLDGDRWELPTKAGGGDCEDLAIMKKAELLKRGWPASTLLLTVGTLRGAGHTVLTVRTSDGDLVLDNVTDAIKPWSKTPYTFYARQKPNAGGGAEWTRI
ncbi:transglutaminase-like cysteine peptidase [Tianweitania sp. BSSL-BM11]|uniref:Transglutaminase-like cysteine peptidase n=1 Tax=Tianweitania aestuarii TaxID=2814886 RepID=A0ABS5RZI5_9HYPH|nr:transglutaminase-like cysteine peptidase [Tianweitania aestuarii]MBS9722443.1 transglutaminase-like cysteine peptidase [Tianweitania aestuarii]